MMKGSRSGRYPWNMSTLSAISSILLLQLFPNRILARRQQHNVVSSSPSTISLASSSCNRFTSSAYRSRLLLGPVDVEDIKSSPILDATPIFELRGGASKRANNRKKGARTATLSSSSKSKSTAATSATGAKKVGAAAAAAASPKKPGAISKIFQKMLPVTRMYITMVVLVTLFGAILGDENAQALLALDPTRILRGWELWRPFTAATFLGKMSLSWIFSGYYLYQYGNTLERAYGTAQFLVFLLTQIIVLSWFSSMMGQPFFTQSVITAMLHVLSRATPRQQVKWLVFEVPYWTLPYGLAIADVLQTQQVMSLVPHLMGVLSGHFYFFHKFVWPKKRGGVDWLAAPDFLVQRLDPNAKKMQAAAAAKLSSKLGSRARKGRKLGGGSGGGDKK